VPTKKRPRGMRAGGGSGAARGRVKPPAARTRVKKPTAKAKRGRATAVRKTVSPARAGRGKSVVPAAAEREIARLKARLQRGKTTLEKRLTEAVREIGQLRYHEARTAQLERQLQERDQIISQLRAEVGALRSRSQERAHESDEAQRSLSFGPSSAGAAEEIGSGSGFYDGDDEPV